MRSLLLAAGDLCDGPAVRNVDYDTVYAADGGYRHAAPLGLSVDAVIGDLDSIAETPDCPTVRYPRQKDETDLELACAYALSQGAKRLTIIGALGGRIDHTLGNIYLLARYPATLVAHNERLTCLHPGTHALNEGPFSLLPLGGPASGITLTHCDYPLENGTLAATEIRGISNHAGANATLTLREGMLLLIEKAEFSGDLRVE